MIIRLAGNAGHDIRLDPGACDPVEPLEGDYINTEEAAWCREVMQMACKKINAKGHKALFIQNDSLAAICTASDEFGADVFISLHLNAAGNTNAQGPETYYCTGSVEGKRLADCVHNLLVERLGAKDRDRGVKSAGFYVIKNTAAPAILIEAGFITNVWEEAQLHAQWAKDAVSDVIAEGTLKYMEVA